MTPKLVLTYFDIAGAAEPVRWALEHSGLEWEDKRLTRDEFAALKPSECIACIPVDASIASASGCLHAVWAGTR